MLQNTFEAKKRVAVLVALYRAGAFIEAKIENLKAQTAFKQCQIVLLNCQNLDDERSTYRSFVADNDNVIEILYETHQKLYKTWNDGINATNTPYIMNSNADDQMHPTCIEKLINALDNDQDHDVAHADYYVTAHRNGIWPNWQYHGLIQTQYPLGSAGPCPIWRRTLHEKYGNFPERWTIGDALMWHKWHTNGIKFLRVPEPLVNYYQEHGHNLETKTDPTTGRTYRDIDLEMGMDDL